MSDDELRRYAIRKTEEPNLPVFLKNLLQAALHAETKDWDLMRPALEQAVARYPLKKQLLTDQNV